MKAVSCSDLSTWLGIYKAIFFHVHLEISTCRFFCTELLKTTAAMWCIYFSDISLVENIVCIRGELEYHPVFPQAIPTAAATADGQGVPTAQIVVFAGTPALSKHRICKRNLSPNLFIHSFNCSESDLWRFKKLHIYQGCMQRFVLTTSSLLKLKQDDLQFEDSLRSKMRAYHKEKKRIKTNKCKKMY